MRLISSHQSRKLTRLIFMRLLSSVEPFDTLAWIMFICVGIPLAATSIFFFEWLSPGGFYAGCRGSPFAAEPKAATAAEESQPLTTREVHKFSFCRTLWLVITILFGSAAHFDSPKGYTARFMVSRRREGKKTPNQQQPHYSLPSCFGNHLLID